jgi:glycosyltransferase involved in cell wall biosynthesis
MSRVRIFYFVYDDNHPRGGEKHSYQHVDILSSSGYEAYALHSQKGFRLAWFENQTPVIDMESFWKLFDCDHDYLVLPESLDALALKAPGRRVIFNKNLYLGYASLAMSRPEVYPFAHEKVVGVFSVSDHNVEQLQFAFPATPIFRMYAHIDCDLFAFQPLVRKKRRIACVTKATKDVAALYHTLFARSAAGHNQLQDYEWIFLQGLSEQETARALGESLLMISLITHEGLPRMILEAMACGCLVVAYGSGPLKECLPEEYRFEHGDLVGMARRIEETCAAFPANIERWSPVAARGRQFAESFTRSRQQAHLLAAWDRILSRQTERRA